MMIDFIRQINAAKNFSIKDDFSFVEFDDITAEEFNEIKTLPDVLEIWAAVKVNYDGTLPESYKVLNLMIGDWVGENVQKLTTEIHTQLKGHFGKNYPDSDSSELENMENSAIWLDQLDYMPIINEDDKSLVIEIELILHAEPIED
jgi:hypothetical protein